MTQIFKRGRTFCIVNTVVLFLSCFIVVFKNDFNKVEYPFISVEI